MNHNEPWPIARALLSVSDKTGLVEFAAGLKKNGIRILSTGGTAKELTDNKIEVTQVSEHTGFPEIMDGRVKTLHPKIHGGILGRHGIDETVMQENGISPIALVVVNLYPFEETIQKPDCTLEDAIENIDIGGPALIRATAKNHANVTVIVDPEDYSGILEEINSNRGVISDETRYKMAVKAFAHTAAYDTAIANYLGKNLPKPTSIIATNVSGLPETLNLQFNLDQTMRYGENPHQKAAFYHEANVPEGCIASAKQVQGKELSYNNINDADAALECIRQFEDPACVIVKHANPCGVATGKSIMSCYERAHSTDAESAFGGIIAFNRQLDLFTAENIISRQFVEVILAPGIDEDAIELISEKKNIRLLTVGTLGTAPARMEFKSVNGGLLVQDSDILLEVELVAVTNRKPTPTEKKDLQFAWKVAKYVKSNAIVYAKRGMTIGVGAGQMSRINSARIASEKAQHANLNVAGSVMASDAFFPFRDGIDQAAKSGITAIIQPGGSMRDKEIISAANEHDIAMVFTGMRHFRH